MEETIQATNEAISAESPALGELLSPLGRRIAFPPDIPFQAEQARGKAFNATIGQITDGAGRALPLPSIAQGLSGLGDADRNRALLYSPVEGVPEIRQLWRTRQRRNVSPSLPTTLPLMTAGLTQGLALLADLFGGPDRSIVVPTPFWGNYRQTFAWRTGARILESPGYRDGRYAPRALADALATLPTGEPAVAILNLPSNPGGYMPRPDERAELTASLFEAADHRPLLVICDDAYAGLVYEEGIDPSSLFFDLVGRHPNLAPVKVDGMTKELSFFGGRVGFLTFGLPADGRAAVALESKAKCLLRATVGSPVATSQYLTLPALRNGNLEQEVQVVRATLARRWSTLQRALEGVDPALLRPLPSNAGCFTLLEITAPGIGSSDLARRHLLEHYDTGLVSIPPNYLRIAFCSVNENRLEELVKRVEAGVRELAASR